MTQRIDVAIGCDIVARWCALAERRLGYLTELFETADGAASTANAPFLRISGKPRQPSKSGAVWAMRYAPPDNSADVSWLGHAGAPLPRADTLRGEVHRLSPQPVEIPVYSPPFEVALALEADILEADHEWSAEASSAADSDAPALEEVSELMLNLDAIEQRYPLLRNAL